MDRPKSGRSLSLTVRFPSQTMSLDESLKELGEFIESERSRYSEDSNNLFAISGSQFSRYLQFLVIIADRHHKAAKASSDYMNNLNDFMKNDTKGKIAVSRLEKLDAGLKLVQLETESFFIFSSIYLDKVAHFIDNYFGRQRGLSLQSHKKLSKNFNEFTINNGITVPKTLFNDITWLYNKITVTRNKMITHQKNPRTIYGASAKGDFSLIFLYPKESDKQVTTPNVEVVAKRLEIYTKRIISLIRSNRKLSRFSNEEI